MASGRVHTQFFLYAKGRGELLHCKMEVEIEEQEGWCYNDSWCILLSFGSCFSRYRSKVLILAQLFLPHL